MKKVRQTDKITFTDTLHLKAIEVSRRTDRQTDRITFTDTLHLEAVDVSRRTDRHNLTGRKTDRQTERHTQRLTQTDSQSNGQTDKPSRQKFYKWMWGVREKIRLVGSVYLFSN